MTQLGGLRGVCLICRDAAATRSSFECVYVFYGNNILVRIKKDTWPEYECNVHAEMWPGPARWVTKRAGTKSGKSRQTGAATGLKCICQTRRLLLSLSPVAYLYPCLCLYFSCQLLATSTSYDLYPPSTDFYPPSSAAIIIIIISMLILAYCPVGKSSLLLLLCYFFPF